MFALHFSFAEQNSWVLHVIYALENNNTRTPYSIFNLFTCFAARVSVVPFSLLQVSLALPVLLSLVKAVCPCTSFYSNTEYR